MKTPRPKLTVLVILAACSVAPVAAGDLIRRDALVDPGSPTTQPLVLADGVLARERVEVDAGALASVPETLWLELEPGQRRLAVLVDSVRTRDGGLVWRGRFIEDDPDYRSIVLSVHDGLVRGSFEAGEVGYSLRPTPGGNELLTLAADREWRCAVEDATAGDVAHRQPAESREPPPRRPGGGSSATAPRRIAAAADEGRTLAVLVLHPPSVAEQWGGRRYVVSYAHHAIDSLNTAFANSRIDGAAFLAGVDEWLPGWSDIRDTLAQAVDSSAVRDSRERAGADLVAVLTDRSSSSGGCGIAHLMSRDRLGPQMAEMAISVTNVDCDGHNHSIFVHEIGHNLGGNHEPGQGFSPPPDRAAFPYAYGYTDGQTGFSSVMAYGSHSRLVFSNPTVLVNGGRPAGIEGERDNARALQQTVPIAAAFRSGGSELPRENVPPPVPPPPIEVPGAPTELRGTVLSATAVRLRWKDNTSGEIGFRIEAAKDSDGIFQTVDEVPVNTVVHVVEGLEPATRYRFRVLALGEHESSPPTAEIQLTTRDAPPAAPAGLTATPATPGAITLSWDAVERATGYEVEVRSANPAADRAALPIVLRPDGARVDGLEPATPYTFRVRALNALGASGWSAGASASTARPGGPCVAGGTALCLLDGRFEVRASWRNPHPPFGHGPAAAKAAPGSDVTGLFTFFDPQNVELVVKMLDGRTVNGAFWHFYGALSDVEYWISAFDTTTGTSRTYHNEPFSLCGDGDTSAFPRRPDSPAAIRSSPLSAAVGTAVVPAAHATAPAIGACSPDEHALCLAGGRFRVEVDWVNPHAPDSHGVGSVFAGAATDLSGHFWFFTPDNLELSVKILDGRTLNGHFWIFWGGLSDVGYTLRVTDTETGETQELTNPPLTLCGGAVTDLL